MNNQNYRNSRIHKTPNKYNVYNNKMYRSQEEINDEYDNIKDSIEDYVEIDEDSQEDIEEIYSIIYPQEYIEEDYSTLNSQEHTEEDDDSVIDYQEHTEDNDDDSVINYQEHTEDDDDDSVIDYQEHTEDDDDSVIDYQEHTEDDDDDSVIDYQEDTEEIFSVVLDADIFESNNQYIHLEESSKTNQYRIASDIEDKDPNHYTLDREVKNINGRGQIYRSKKIIIDKPPKDVIVKIDKIKRELHIEDVELSDDIATVIAVLTETITYFTSKPIPCKSNQNDDESNKDESGKDESGKDNKKEKNKDILKDNSENNDSIAVDGVVRNTTIIIPCIIYIDVPGTKLGDKYKIINPTVESINIKYILDNGDIVNGNIPVGQYIEGLMEGYAISVGINIL